MDEAPPPLLLHVFASFAVGGAQVRFATLANRFGRRYRHIVVAMDGNYACASLVAPDLDVRYETVTVDKRATLTNENIRLSVIGRRAGLPDSVLREMDKTIDLSSHHSGMRLCLAINYGGRSEMVDAVRAIAQAVRQGNLNADEVGEQTIADHLYTAGMSDPDLLIRTAGEMRISNFLLWQISYAELWVTEHCWPEFRETDLHEAIRDFASRDRRFGGLSQGKPWLGETT